jgi:DNA-binding CsgD family transcriptional regulator
MLDDWGEAVLLCDRAGQVLHRTPALDRLLNEDAEGRLRGEVLCTARSWSRLADQPVGEERAAASREVKTAKGRYRLQASLVGAEITGGEEGVMVRVEPLTPAVLSASALRERLGLTKAEARVASLLAEGKSNADIAGQLFISPHTVRHHTEHVLQKLGVHSRAEVGPTLMRVTARDPLRFSRSPPGP